jgi:fibro-slime domain-containing protein
MPLPIVFVQQLDGSYLFDDAFDEHYASRGGFYPIDDQLFGNDTGTHNSYFTFAFEAGFVLDLATDPYFEVETDSDVWVYIDDQVAIDLGGVHGIHEQRVDLVSMCLLDGEPHTLRFYLAHRHGAGSKLRIRTNLELEGNQPPAITAPYD